MLKDFLEVQGTYLVPVSLRNDTSVAEPFLQRFGQGAYSLPHVSYFMTFNDCINVNLAGGLAIGVIDYILDQTLTTQSVTRLMLVVGTARSS
jgi:hypothetical protein